MDTIYNPKFIPLKNEGPLTYWKYDSVHGKSLLQRQYSKEKKATPFADALLKCIEKCKEYHGEEVADDYITYHAHSMLSKHFFLEPKSQECKQIRNLHDPVMLILSPDETYTRVFDKYFEEQNQLREGLNAKQVDHTEQVSQLTQLSSLYSDKLTLARQHSSRAELPGNFQVHLTTYRHTRTDTEDLMAMAERCPETANSKTGNKMIGDDLEVISDLALSGESTIDDFKFSFGGIEFETCSSGDGLAEEDSEGDLIPLLEGEESESELVEDGTITDGWVLITTVTGSG